MKTHFSFPGFGIGTHLLNRVAFTLFGVIEVHWGGLLTLFAICLSLICVILRAVRSERLGGTAVFDCALVAVLSGAVCARAFYVLLTLDRAVYATAWDVIDVWNGGGLAWGAILGGFVGILIMACVKRISWKRLLDAAAPAWLLGLAVGSWSALFSGAVPGAVVDTHTVFDLFGLRLRLPSGEGTLFHVLRMGLEKYGVFAYYQPTFLYECVWSAIGFIVLNIVYKRRKFNGQVALMGLAWYALGSILIDGLEADALYISGTSLRLSQCVGALCLIAATVALVALCRKYANNDPFARPVPPHPDDAQWKNKEDNALSRALERALIKRKNNNKEKMKHGNKN